MQKGVSLYLTLVIMTLMLAIALGISAILVGQMKIIKGMGDSVIAFYAADTGIERILYDIRKTPYNPTGGTEPYTNIALDNGATYTVKIISANGTVTISSKGTYKDVNRAIEISY
jgi:Tfp pilus assembly protein PilX